MVSAIALGVLLSLWGTGLVSPSRAQEFQNVPIFLRASDVLPREILSGPNYVVRETVRNDGLVNTYDIETQYGLLTVESTDLLLKRIAELNALWKLQALIGPRIYAESFKDTALGPLRTVTGIVTGPEQTVKEVGTGVGNFFTKAGAVTSDDPDKDKLLNAALGQAAFRREFAFKLGVDPYTRYEPLQKELTKVSWSAAAGKLTVKAVFMAIPGVGRGVASLLVTADAMRNLVRDKTPPEIEKINRKTLYDMDVVDPLAGSFLSSTTYSPQEKTLLVGALASMAGVKDRGVFVESAASDYYVESVALFMRICAEMASQYCAKKGGVERFVNAGGIPFLLTKDRVVVGLFPLDHVAWTVNFARQETQVSDAIEKIPGVKGKELWISGTIDPVARRALESKGWVVEERVNNRLRAQEGEEVPTTVEDAPLRPEEIDQLNAPATGHGVTDKPMNMK
jgi:hypothetical protein